MDKNTLNASIALFLILSLCGLHGCSDSNPPGPSAEMTAQDEAAPQAKISPTANPKTPQEPIGKNANAATPSKDQKKLAELMTAFFGESIQQGEAWEKTIASVQAPDIFNFSLANTDQEFERQKQVIANYVKKAKDHKKQIEEAIPKLKKKITGILTKGSPMGAETIRSLEENYRNQKPILDKLIQAHVDYGNRLIEALNLLQKNKGKWSYTNGQMTIEDDAVRTEFNKIMDAAKEQEVLINQLSQQLYKPGY